MSQEIINTGDAPNDGTGDPLRTAFQKTDDNFDQIWAAGPVGSNVRIQGNTISTITVNTDLSLSPNGAANIRLNNNAVPGANNTWYLGSATNRWRGVFLGTGNLDVLGNVTIAGNLTAGNISYTGNVFVGDLQGSVFADDSTLIVDAINNAVYSDTIAASGNVTANLFIGNGALLTDIISSYGNANVVANLAALGTNPVVTTGNVTAEYFIGNGSQLTGLPISYSDANVATFLAAFGSNTVSTTGNISANHFLGNIAAANVVGTVASAATVTTAAQPNITSVGTLTSVSVTGNVTGGNIITAGRVSASGNILGFNFATEGSVQASSVEATGNITGANLSVTGNVTGDYFIGDGSQLTGITANTANITSNVITFNTAAGISVAAGQMAWNSADGTLDIGIGYGNVVLQTGQETHYVVRNETGNVISDGTAVYCSGVTPSGRISIDLMTSNIDPVQFLGLATQDISNGVNGVVTWFGYVRDLDTRGTANTAISVGDENWAVGDKLYVHPTAPGKLTKVEPAAPNVKICVASVIIRNQTAGVLFVRPTTNLTAADLSDVQITTPAANQFLVYAGNRWENTALDISLDTTPTLGGNLAGAGFDISNVSNVSAVGNITGGNIITNGSVNTAGNVNFTSAEATDTARIFADVSDTTTSLVLEVGDDDPDSIVLRHYSFAAGNTIDMLRAQRASNTTANVTVTGNVIATGNISAARLQNDGNLEIRSNVAGTIKNWTFDTLGDFNMPVGGNISGSGLITANRVSATGNVTGGNLISSATIYGNVDVVLGNIANTSATKTRMVTDTTFSYIQTGNGTVGTTGNIVFSPYLDTVQRVVIDTASGNLTAAGNVTAQNFTGNISITGNVQGTSANVDLVAGGNTWSFNNTGNLVLPGNTFAVNYANNTPVDVVTRFEGSWNVPTGNTTQSFTVDGNNSYQMWLEGNIPNGIIIWNATVTVTNTNVPVIGQQFAWNYEGGGNILMFNSIPAQIIGTAGAISNAEPAVGNTTNVFSFGINNASGNVANVRYGWIQIS